MDNSTTGHHQIPDPTLVYQTSSSTSSTRPSTIDPHQEAYWYWTTVIIIGIITTLGNWLVIYVIVTRQRLHTISNCYILSLAVSDLLIGIIVVPTSVINNFAPIAHFPILITFYDLLFYVSVGNLCVMTLDRYVAVTQPFKYITVMTYRRVVLTIALAWLIPSLIALLPLVWYHLDDPFYKSRLDHVYVLVLVIGLEMLPCVVMVLIYARLFVIARKHSRMISSQRNACFGMTSVAGISYPREERSNLKAFATVVAIFVACWILSSYRVLCKELKLCEVTSLMIQISRILMFLNTSLNFIVYAVLKTDIRGEFLIVFRKTAKSIQSFCKLA